MCPFCPTCPSPASQTGVVEFGEPGTNGQHSFYQLLHQGRVVPADFVAFCESQTPVALAGEPVSNHDELMSNFFAQPDALAMGKTAEEVAAGESRARGDRIHSYPHASRRLTYTPITLIPLSPFACRLHFAAVLMMNCCLCVAEGAKPSIVPHKVFEGNRPSLSLLLPRLDAYTAGQLLALYEHRTAVEGFVWGIASFDQWGVELGKVLAKAVRGQLQGSRSEGKAVSGFNPSTTALLERYLAHKQQ